MNSISPEQETAERTQNADKTRLYRKNVGIMIINANKKVWFAFLA